MKLLILQGLPASGKTTWARGFVSINKDWVRVNRDDLRNMRGEYWVPKQEKLITQWENECVLTALTDGYNVILDATNLNKERIRQRVNDWAFWFPDGELKIEYKFFDIPLDECFKRDIKRANSVGAKVIQGMYDKYLAPPPIEYVEDKTLPHCIICDIDGTLAQMKGRSPFDWDKVGNDVLNVGVREILEAVSDSHEIFLFSGRDSVCKKQTIDWLIKHNVPYNDILMRAEGSVDDDRVVKRKMFEDVVRGRYYCDFVLDDRDKVVEMWRKELGLTCLQVNYGDF